MTETEEKLLSTEFLVEATSCEQLDLWVKFHNELPWEQINPGWLVQVGVLDNMPISISLNWCRIRGHLICFWEATSQVVDHRQIDAWFAKHYKQTYGGGRPTTCNAMNFHLCRNHILRHCYGEQK